MLLNNQQSNFAHARSFLSVFFGWAIQKEYCEHNIARDIELKYLFARKSVKHHAHFSELKDILTLKKEVENCGSSYVYKLLFLFQLYTAVRPSEARLATWDEIDLEKRHLENSSVSYENEKNPRSSFEQTTYKSSKRV